MTDTEVKSILTKAKTIAIIGAKDSPGPANAVGKYLIDAGYTVIPVHPVRKEVWGLPAYQTINDIPVPIDIVDVFRAPEFCLAHAQEASILEHTPMLFWMQLGIRNEDAVAQVESKGIPAIEDACLMVERKRLFSTNR